MESVHVQAVAETHFFIRPYLLKALEDYQITDEGRRFLGDAQNYREVWERDYSDRFFDMATFIRLGTAIEVGLREYHGRHGGPSSERGLYQRVVNPASLIKVFKKDCSYDLASNPHWQAVREIMTHRHLFAHRSGLVDENYVRSWSIVSGIDLEPKLRTHGYPTEEVYWFEPLHDLPRYIEAVRSFFRAFPDESS